MKTLTHIAGGVVLAVIIVLLGGCMMPNFTRIIPENKDANIFFLHPMYGQMIIQTRVNPGGTNTLPMLSNEQPMKGFQ